MGLLQIAPAEAPDAKVRMVIITGPPEAQFKVCAMEGTGTQREQDAAAFSSPGITGNPKDQGGAMPEFYHKHKPGAFSSVWCWLLSLLTWWDLNEPCKPALHIPFCLGDALTFSGPAALTAGPFLLAFTVLGF